jgi:hypothetical protein
MTDSKSALLRALWRDKMHVEPMALDLASASVRAAYEHIWQPAELLMGDLQVLPLGLLRFWQDGSAGHLIFTHRPSSYRPGPQPWRETMLDGLCDLSIVELLEDKGRAMRALFNLLDHLLGSSGVAGGAWLSDGAGATAALRRLGARLVRIYALGHWQGELPGQSLAQHDIHSYLARVWWLYLDDPRRLNTVDPLAHRLLTTTLMNERFWAEVTRDIPGAT